MKGVRGALRSVALAWLVCQAATLMAAPVVIWVGAPTAGVAQCTCIHGDHAFCPMHHKPAPGSTICLMQNAGDRGTAVFGWLLHAGLVPTSTAAAVIPERPIVLRLIDNATASLRPAPPDPPPPRA